MNPQNPLPQPPQDNPSLPTPQPETPGNVFTPTPPISDSQPSYDPLANQQSQPAWQPQTEKPRGKFRRFFKSRLAVMIIALLIILSSGAGAFFGYYLPNKPENVWSTALSRTAKGYDKLAEYVSEKRDSQGVVIKGSFKLSGGLAADGTFEGKSNDDNGEFKGLISATGLKINLDLKTLKSPGNSPDIYFKLTGLEGLGELLGGGDPTATSAFNSLNNQWYFIDHTLFDQLAPGSNTRTQITTDDVSSILKAVGDATREYIFSNDSKKAALTVRQKVGKEKQDNRSVYHYKIGFNKENLKAYATKLCDNLKASKLNEFFNGDTASVEGALDCQGLKDSINKINDSKTADAWVDLKTKLIRKVRFTYSSGQKKTGDVEVQPGQDDFSSEPQRNGYVEISQNYTGGDVFPFKIYYQNEEKYTYSSTDTSTTTTSGELNVSLDMKSNKLTLAGDYQTKSVGDGSSVKFNLSVSPSPGEIKVGKPAKSKNLIQLLNDLGFGELFSGDGSGLFVTETQARDTERKTDIKAMQGQLEAYWADNGFYPTLGEVNDPNWRSQNFVGLDSEALKDPQGTSQKLVGSPKAKSYSYVASPSGCNNVECTSFTLTATLEGGGTFSVRSLN